MAFWLPWAFDGCITLLVLYYFFVGLADGSVSSFNAGLWSIILTVFGGVMGGSLWLRSVGHRKSALVLLLLVAVPGFLYVLSLLVVLVGQLRWN